MPMALGDLCEREVSLADQTLCLADAQRREIAHHALADLLVEHALEL